VLGRCVSDIKPLFQEMQRAVNQQSDKEGWLFAKNEKVDKGIA
jgi:hypothetical protein